MDELRTLDIAYKFCRRVLQECTGNRAEFAEYLGIAPCRVTIYKKKIEQVYNVKILHSRKRHTYFVNENDRYKLPPPLFRMIINYIKIKKSAWQYRTGLYL